EGCTAPVFTTNSLHSAVVEIFVKKDAYCRYTTIQNWANNVYNLVTKRATVEANGTMEWIDGNIGSKLTMNYPSVLLKGEGSRGMTISIALAGKGQHQDAGAKMHTWHQIHHHRLFRNLFLNRVVKYLIEELYISDVKQTVPAPILSVIH